MEKKYAIQGIIGCILFGIGDWLLGFVDPKAVEGDVFYFISVGAWLGVCLCKGAVHVLHERWDDGLVY